MYLSSQSYVTSEIDTVVLELMLFVDVTNEVIEDRKMDGKFLVKGTEYYIYKRYFADSMLEWFLKYKITFGIWTHETRRVATMIVKTVFPDILKKMKLLYTRKSCTIFQDTYVKNTRKLNKRTLFVDFNTVQLYYNISEKNPFPVLIDENADLKKIFWWLRRKFSLPLKNKFKSKKQHILSSITKASVNV